jgi:acetyl esterase/lipase
MRRMRTLALALLFALPLAAQVDVLRDVVVLKTAGTDAVEVRKDIRYGGEHAFDLYRPPKSNAALPLVIFLNGVGRPELKNWGQYTSWPRLVATRGAAAISYSTAGDDAATYAQTETLLKYLREHAAELKLDMSRIAIWSCSANVRNGTAMLAKMPSLRAAVFYYGIMSTPPSQPDVPVLVARAGLDVLTINESIDRWTAQAVELDAPVTLIAYPHGRHGFELIDDTNESRAIVKQTLDFLEFHLKNAPPPRTEPMSPSQLQRFLRSEGAAGLTARVRALRKSHPNAVALQEPTLNTLGYTLLSMNNVADAVTIFEMVAELYPQSANAHDSLGDGYEAAGRKADAIAASEKALTLLGTLPPARADAIRKSAEEKLARLRR